MKDKLDAFIEALREELKEYGGLLALLEEQQDQLIRRAADEVLNTVTSIDVRTTAIQQVRNRRERSRADLAAVYELSPEATVLELVGWLPETRRPLLRALIDENNALVIRVRERAQQNHLLLSHSLSLMQRFFNALFPGSRPLVYSEDGFAPPTPATGHSLYDAVG